MTTMTDHPPEASLASPLDQLRCLRRIERFVERFFANRELVDLHELAMKLWEEDAEMPLWLLRLRCISALKVHNLEEKQDQGDSQQSQADARELVNALCTEMPHTTRHIFYLRFWKDLSVDEIALELNWQPKAVRASLRHWLFVLRSKHEQSLERTTHETP